MVLRRVKIIGKTVRTNFSVGLLISVLCGKIDRCDKWYSG